MNGRLRRAGFTLVELLVVTIIVAILFYVFVVRPGSDSRNRARQMQCMCNLKCVALGLKTYCDDYDQKFPTLHAGSTARGRWTGRADTMPYAQSDASVSSRAIAVWPVFAHRNGNEGELACPSAGATRQKPFTYFFNRRLSGKSLGDVAYPANCIIVGDWVPYGTKEVATSTTWDITRSERSRPAGSWEAGDRHSPGAIYGFVDGHVKNLRRADILASPAGAAKPPAGYEYRLSLYP